MPTLDNNLDIVVRSQYDSSGLDKAQQNVQKLADSTSAAASRMRQDFGSVTSIITALGATALVGATANAVKFGVNSAASFEQSRVAFENMLGSTEKARD